MTWELDTGSKDKKEAICLDGLEPGFLGIWKTGASDGTLGDFLKILMLVAHPRF